MTAAILERDGTILVARRRRGDANALWWELPGGKIEPGETPEACLRRELVEELGIEVRVGALVGTHVHTYPHATIRLHVYRVAWEGDPATIVPRVHDAVAWVPRAELRVEDFSEADRPFVEGLVRQIPVQAHRSRG